MCSSDNKAGPVSSKIITKRIKSNMKIIGTDLIENEKGAIIAQLSDSVGLSRQCSYIPMFCRPEPPTAQAARAAVLKLCIYTVAYKLANLIICLTTSERE